MDRRWTLEAGHLEEATCRKCKVSATVLSIAWGMESLQDASGRHAEIARRCINSKLTDDSQGPSAIRHASGCIAVLEYRADRSVEFKFHLKPKSQITVSINPKVLPTEPCR